MNKTSPDDAQVQSSAENPSAIVATTSVVIGFDIGRTFIFYDHSKSAEDNWKKLFSNQTCWKCGQFNEFRQPFGLIAKLSMKDCATVDQEKIAELVTVFDESFGAELTPASIETTFFGPGVGVLRLELSFPSSADVALRLSKLSDKRERSPIRTRLHDLIRAAAKCYTDCLDTAIAAAKAEKRESPIKPFKVVDRSKSGYPVFFMVSFVDQPTFDARARSIRDLLAVTDEQRRAFDERARVGYEGATVFVDWDEALVTGNRDEQKQEIETNFIIAMASWSALSLMERHSSKDIFDVFAQIVGARANLSSVNDIYMRGMAYRDVSDARLPIRWSENSRDLHLLEAIHRNWSSDRLQRVIGERMAALSLHHQRIEHEQRERFNEQRERFNARQDRLNRRLTMFGIIVAISTLASGAASLFNLGHTSGSRAVILSLALVGLGCVVFLVIYLWSKRSPTAD